MRLQNLSDTHRLARNASVCFLVLIAAANAAVNGTKVTNVSVANGDATITITNTTQHAVTAWAVETLTTQEDGTPVRLQHLEEYGVGKLKPGEHIEYTQNAKTNNITASVIVAFYDDNTAEVGDDDAFHQILDARVATAEALSLSAEIFKNAVSDDSPRERAKRDFSAAILSVKKGSIQQRDARTFLRLLQKNLATLNSMDQIPEKQNDSEFMRQRSEDYQTRANVEKNLISIRRLQ